YDTPTTTSYTLSLHDALPILADGDALIYLGAGMESFAETTVNALESQDINFMEIGQHEALFSSPKNTSEHTHGDVDPHIWLDPLRMVKVGELIKDELIKISPEDE